MPPTPTPAKSVPTLRAEWRPVAGLTAWFAFVALAIVAWRDVPVIDDWTYAWSVEQLLAHGRLQVLDWSAVYPLGHALWGAGWSLVLGFSFGALRLSTLALGAVAAAALYFLLRELGAAPRLARFGAAVLAVNPAFVLLSSSFMTDVPFVAFTLLALLGYVRAVRRADVRWVWWGGVWACLSCLDRQVGVLTPIAALPLLISPAPGLRRPAVAVALVTTWLVMLAGAAGVAAAIGTTGEQRTLLAALGYLTSLPADRYLAYSLTVLTAVAFFALPALVVLSAASATWRRAALPIAVAALATVMLAVNGEIPLPLRPGGTWTLLELGGPRQLVPGAWSAAAPPWIEHLLRAAGVVAFGLAVLAVGRRPAALDAPSRPRPGAVAAALGDPRAPLLTYLAAYVVLVNVLWFFNDRYVLVLLPVLVALALGRATVPTVGLRAGWALAAVYAVVAVVGTRDTLRFHEAVRDEWQALVDAGVPPGDIDAGYVWNGWMLYAHPQNLRPGEGRDSVPWITSRRRLPFTIAKAPLEGYDVARQVEWRGDAPWPGPDRLYVLRRREVPPPARRPAG
ncbi:MAG: ArnT family glycosyltransferase [Vicinamibacterales bacterium]